MKVSSGETRLLQQYLKENKMVDDFENDTVRLDEVLKHFYMIFIIIIFLALSHQ